MKKETIFRHELNESIQANAAMNCLKNRNNHKQINEVAPVVASAGRMLLPMLRPVITKLVQKALVKIGTHARPTEVLKLVMGMLTKGELAKKMAEKCGQTWNEIPSSVKKEIQNAIIDAFKAQSPQEQEETVDYAQLADDVCASYRVPLSKLDLKDSINYIVKMVAKKIGKTVDALTPEELSAIQKAAKHSVWYVSEQEETDDYDKDEVAMQLVKKSKNTLKTSWAEAPEMFILQKVRRMIGGVGRGSWWRLGLVDWVKAICNACDVVLGKTNDREIKTLITYELGHHYLQQDVRKLGMAASHVIEKTGDKPTSFDVKEINAWIRKHDNDFRRVLFGSTQEQEEFDMEGSRDAYYSQDEPDYDDDSHGIRLILNMLMKRGDIIKSDIPRVQGQIKSMLDANGMWIGDDDHEAERFIEMYWDNQEQEENSLDTEYFSDLEEQEAYYENFRAIAELVADQIDRENGKGIDNNMDTLFAIVREVWNNNPDDLYIWDFDDVQKKDCYKFFDKYYETIKNEYLKREHNNIMDATHDDLFEFSEQEELPQMERHDIILALAQYMSESWLETDDGDLDDIYYTISDIINETGDCPPSPSWEDCKDWCQKYYQDVETIIGIH